MGKVFRERFKVQEGVFDEFTIRTLEFLQRRKYFDELKGPIKTGKEGDVYLALRGGKKIALKIFRINTANFKKITQYIQKDLRFKNLRGNMRKIILKWAEKEYRNLLLCHRAGLSVPQPFKQMNNIIVMEYIEGEMLKDTQLEDPKKFYKALQKELKKLKDKVKMIHADLSEFNILVKDQKPIIIDMGQAFSYKDELDFEELREYYERDMRNIKKYFKNKYGI